MVSKSLSHIGWDSYFSFAVTFVPQKDPWNVIVQVVLITLFYPRWQGLVRERKDDYTHSWKWHSTHYFIKWCNHSIGDLPTHNTWWINCHVTRKDITLLMLSLQQWARARHKTIQMQKLLYKAKQTFGKLDLIENTVWCAWVSHLKGRHPGDVINKHDSINIPVVVLHHGPPEPLLASCVPQLQLHQEISMKLIQ